MLMLTMCGHAWAQLPRSVSDKTTKRKMMKRRRMTANELT